MPRDTRSVNQTKTIQQYNVTLGTEGSASNVNHIALHQSRDDSEGTAPVRGQYVRPTAYFARYYVGTSSAYDYRYRTTLNQVAGVRGEATLSQTMSPAIPYRHQADVNGLVTLPTWMTSAAESKVRAQISNSLWDAGVTLGELPETLRSIRDLFGTLFDFALAFKKGDVTRLDDVALSHAKRELARFGKQDRKYAAFRQWAPGDYLTKSATREALNRRRYREFRKWAYAPRRSRLSKARKAVKAGAQGWLAYKFFWLPIMSDIYDATETLNSALLQEGAFQASATVSSDCPPFTWNESSNVIWSKQFKGKMDCTVRCAYSLLNPEVYQLSRFGILNPLAIAWELLPLSFVIDWFVPFGNFYASLTRPAGLVFSWGSRTSYLEWNASAEWAFFRGSYRSFISGSRPSASAYCKSFRRDLYLSFPTPTPYFRGVDNLGLDKLITIAALALR